jgi:ABC-2 type transport system permease protein
VEDGLQEMLESYGVKVEQALVMDTRNEAFPQQVQRQVGGFNVVEVQELDYPLFVDVRRDSMATESPIVANLSAVTLQWASPLVVDPEKNKDRDVVTLLESTDESWLRASTDIQPNLDLYPRLGFPVEGEQAARPLAVSLRGAFESYFKDRPSPFQEGAAEEEGASDALAEADAGAEQEPILGTLEESPESSRLIVIGSSEFLDDAVLELSSRLSADRYLLNLQFLQNAVDWSVEDQDLLSIRSRGSYTRLLEPMEKSEQSFWEVLNYGLALAAVVVIGVVWNVRQRSEAPMPLVDLESGEEA